MRNIIAPLVLCILAAMARSASAGHDPTDAEIEKAMNPAGYVTLLGASRDFAALQKQAQQKTHADYSMHGNVFNRKKGLVSKDDPVWQGQYLFRRDDTTQIRGKDLPFLSIEKSDAYPGMKKGLYIIVGGISLSRKDATTALARYAQSVPGAYNARTTIYIGCMH
jgi:hypothetical protein